MIYKVTSVVDEIPHLFCQLDELSNSGTTLVETIATEGIHIDYNCWREKARWIRFEEQAENVSGRWSKPHVATLLQTSIDDLKELLKESVIMLDVLFTDVKEIAEAVKNEIIDHFDDVSCAKKFIEIMCLPHIHHHEKRLRPSFSNRDLDSPLIDSHLDSQPVYSLKNQINNRDAFQFQDDFTLDFKENTKIKKKMNQRAEGASILIAPLNFVKAPKLVFIRLDAATELPGFLEVKVKSRFIVLIVGPSDIHIQMYEIGRVIATCLADDVCREHLYASKTQSDVLNAINLFNNSTMLIPASHWDPRIQIEPPEKYLSKEERKALPALTEYLHRKQEKYLIESHESPGLEFTITPFSGLLNDVKRKLTFFKSDLKDAFNLQCMAAILYMYLVSLCSLVTFGVLLDKYTAHDMGIVECILSGAICGVIFSLFSGQPLNILSATGPMLILEGILHRFTERYNFDYMEFRLWTGLWTAIILFALVVFNLSFLVKYITRFTEECFASLVAILFVIDAFKNVFKLYKKYPVKFSSRVFKYDTKYECTCLFNNQTDDNDLNVAERIVAMNNETMLDYQEDCYNKSGIFNCLPIISDTNYIPDIFLFSTILFTFTFALSMLLKHFRDTKFLPTKIRQIISDFAVIITIVAMAFFDVSFGIKTPKLTVPSNFVPTKPGRTWIVPFYSGKNSWWTILLAILPALVTTILIFMDQHITAVIINRKEFKLKKSYGYHLDLLAVAITIALCSILGAPWFVAATVLSLTHINALKIMSENTAPGERATFLGVREQRVTSFLVSILIGLSIFFTSFIKFIPMPVLYAVFLFMGVNALNGMQFINRIMVIFIPTKYQPDYSYLKHVTTGRVHLFTIIQFLSTAGLYAVKAIEATSIAFPIMIVATCGVRKLMDYIFSQTELYWLDDILPNRSKKSKQNYNENAFNDSTNNFLLESLKENGPTGTIDVNENEKISKLETKIETIALDDNAFINEKNPIKINVQMMK